MEKFYVTTPIYYVNDIPHIGHAYTTVAADILARFNRLLGKKVFFLTGTDEHGQKVQKAAQQRGLSPKEHADKMVVNFQKLWKKLNISNNAFIRTTDEEHKKVVQDILSQLYEKGEIVKKTYKGWYCTADERFWTEKEVLERKCPECGREVDQLQEENYFFLMSKYQQKLIDHIEKNPDYILPLTRKNEVMGFLKKRPLGDLCISRPKKRLSWGIPLPFDKEYVTYVWFDALLNYYSATKYLMQDGAWWPADHHIIGKDILTTHAVYWSTMLMALEIPLPKNIFAHGWWTVEGRKMSKSIGNVVEPEKIIDKYGVDAFRYFLFKEVPFGIDGDFSEKAIIERFNSDLANDLGNLLNRSISMLFRYMDGVVPFTKEVEEEAKILAEGILSRIKQHLEKLAFQKALDEIWTLVDYLNKYIDFNQPWKLAKLPENKDKLSTVLYTSLEGLRFLSLYLYPFMPESAEKIHYAVSCEKINPDAYKQLKWGKLPSGIVLNKPKPIFPRIQEESFKEKNKKNIINIEEFKKVELKVAKVVKAERVKNSNKLLKLIVDIGEKRQIIAGIGTSYNPEDLIGSNVVIVSNLKPAKIMGIKSEGMLLAVSEGEKISIISPIKDVTPGSRVM